jgi:DNA-binding PadR family transcriptional regulator
MTYPLKILALLYNDSKGKQLWEIRLGFRPLEPNYQVLRNTLVFLHKKGLIEVDRRLGHKHYIYKITDLGKQYFEKNYIPLKLIEEIKIRGMLHEPSTECNVGK